MKLSMSMIAWYLKNYRPQTKIVNDMAVIKGIRFLSEDPGEFPCEYIYIGDAQKFFSDKKLSDCFILVQGKNHLLFWDIEYETLLNALLSSFDYFNNWERKLVEATSEGCTLQTILEIAWPLLENPASIGDIHNKVYAYMPKPYEGDDPYWAYAVRNGTPHPMVFEKAFFDEQGNLIQELGEEAKLVQNVYDGGAPVMMNYIRQNGEIVACLSILQENHTMLDMNRQIGKILSKYIVLTSEFVSEQALIRSGESLLRSFIEGNMIRDEYGNASVETLKERGLSNSFRFILIRHIIRRDSIQRTALFHRIKRRKEFILPIIYEEQIAALIDDSIADNIEGIIQSVNQSENLQIAMSMISVDPFSIPANYRQALFAMEKAGNNPGVYRCEEFAFDYLMESFRKFEMTQPLLHPALQILDQYDRKNDAELNKTLQVFLDKEKNYLETAETLHIHRNTLKYRLGRILEITGISLIDEEELKYLRLSYWLSFPEEFGK